MTFSCCTIVPPAALSCGGMVGRCYKKEDDEAVNCDWNCELHCFKTFSAEEESIMMTTTMMRMMRMMMMRRRRRRRRGRRRRRVTISPRIYPATVTHLFYKTENWSNV